METEAQPDIRRVLQQGRRYRHRDSQRIDRRNVIIDLGKAEAIMLPSEADQWGEEYRFNDRLRVYIVEVKKTTKGPPDTCVRDAPGLSRRLFELEVPEIHDGTVGNKEHFPRSRFRDQNSRLFKGSNVDPSAHASDRGDEGAGDRR